MRSKTKREGHGCLNNKKGREEDNVGGLRWNCLRRGKEKKEKKKNRTITRAALEAKIGQDRRSKEVPQPNVLKMGDQRSLSMASNESGGKKQQKGNRHRSLLSTSGKVGHSAGGKFSENG